MTKEKFINQYKIKDALPLDPSKRALPAEAFSAALKDFLEDRLQGAVRVDSDIISAQSILISAEYAAYFFKILLTDIYGRQLLRVKMTSDEKDFNVLITADEPLLLTDREMRDLIRLARNAGMEISPDECSLRLTAGLSPATIRRVYAVSVADGRRVMLGKLCEIFFCGEPLEDTKEVDVLTICWRSQQKSKKRTE